MNSFFYKKGVVFYINRALSLNCKILSAKRGALTVLHQLQVKLFATLKKNALNPMYAS